MPIGFNVRIMPGVRLSASTRGIRAGFGPRIARVNVGTRGVGVSTGAGPFYASTRLSPRRKAGRRTATPSLAAYQREVRRAQRQQEIAEAAKLEQRLVSVHLEDFPRAHPPRAAPPDSVDGAAIHKVLRKQALSGISWFKWSERRAAKLTAAEQAEREIESKRRERTDAQAAEQARLNADWRKLVDNDPATVLAVLDAAFEDNQAPAAPINCEQDEVTVMMLYESPALIPDRKPALTPSGNPTLHKRNKTERNELYAASLASNVLATTKEALAVAPGINRVVAMVVRKDEPPQPAQPILSCLYCGRFERDYFRHLDWFHATPLSVISATPGALIERKGRTAEVAPLNLSNSPDLAAALRSAAEMLGCEPNLGTRRR